MEFSSLELLASTALRENNALPPTQDPQHKDSNNAQEKDDGGDDDETDGKTVVAISKDVTVVKSTSEQNMGSVKCGSKHKKPVSKTMVKSIFVRDGKCVAKEVSSEMVIPSKNGNNRPLTGLASVALVNRVGVKDKLDVDVFTNNNALPCDGQAQSDTSQEVKDDTCKCNSEKEGEANMVPGSATDMANGDVLTDQQNELNFFVAPATSDPSLMLGEVSDASQTNSSLPQKPHSSAALTAAASGALEVAQLSQKGVDTESSDFVSSACSVNTSNPEAIQQVQKQQLCSTGGGSGTKSKGVVSDPHSGQIPELQAIQGGQVIAAVRQASQTISTQEAMEIDSCDNCDENRHVQPTSSSSLSSVPSSAFTHPSAGSSLNSLASKVDQKTFNSSGNQLADPSSCTLLSILAQPAPPPLIPLNLIVNSIQLDHCYGRLASRPTSGSNMDNAEDSGDAFESADDNASADDIERRPRSLSVDSVYLQNGGAAATPSPLEGASQTDKLSLLSPAPSVDSTSNDSSQSEQLNILTGGHFYSILTGAQNHTRLSAAYPAGKSSLLDDLNCGTQIGLEKARVGASLLTGNNLVNTPSSRKFQIGNFGSFSISHLDCGNEGKNKLKIGIPSEPAMKHSISSPALASPGSPFPMLQSPGMEWDRSDAGSEVQDDADSTTTEDKILSSSLDSDIQIGTVQQIWNHPVYHDHDYCSREVSEKLGKPKAPPLPVKNPRRKQSKKKDRLSLEDKGKYLKMELLKQDNRFSLLKNSGRADTKTFLPQMSHIPDLQNSKPNPVGRPRKRSEKPVDDYDSETGTKMKITGKYQDQYVYYYSKTSRSRRRKFEEKVPSGDRIIIPTPKPGDIVVPHLTDADCEAIRVGGRSAFRGAPNFSNHHSALSSVGGEQPELMDSSIVNTILSMENDPPQWAAQNTAHDGELADKLTTEQVDLLIDCLQTAEKTGTDFSKFLTTADTVPFTSSTMDSLAATTVEEDFLSLTTSLPLVSPPNSLNLVSSPSSLNLVSSNSLPLLSLPNPLPSVSTPCLSVPATSMMDLKPQVDVILSLPQDVTSTCSLPTLGHSVEKNLEFLTNDFYASVSSIAPTSGVASFTSLMSDADFGAVESVGEVQNDVNETPWIVTVTLYDNDIPAIIINNSPFVRLVDIHRQILPAKDTGILKKRCQLLKIAVTNCSEMQRYFLVQYGRAHNSKSTLVITKDEAWRLISYYAQPQPRNLRGDEASGLRRSSSLADLRPFGESRSATSSPTPAFAQPRKRGGFRRKGSTIRSHNPSPEHFMAAVTPQGVDQPPPPSPLPAEPASPSKRTRHKKINFRELLKGEDGSSQVLSPLAEGAYTGDESMSDILAGRGNTPGKREASRDPNVVSAKRRRKDGRKSLETRKKEVMDVSPDAAASEVEISVDEISPTPPLSVAAVKSKKRSPGTSASSLGTPARSLKNKFGPIKVNVRSLVHSGPPLKNQVRKKTLFGRKNSSRDGIEISPIADHPLRVLSICHQDSQASDTSNTPEVLSPAAEMHLDLYLHASSPCVLCHVCKTYMSVADFIKHQHASGSEKLVEVPGQRKLFPLNKENLSDEEQKIWQEFLHRRTQYDQPAVSAMFVPLSVASKQDEMYNAGPPELVVRQNSQVPRRMSLPGNVSSAAMETNGSPQVADVASPEAMVVDHTDDAQVVDATSQSSLPLTHPSTHTENEEKLVDSITVDAVSPNTTTPNSALVTARRQQQHTRSRKASTSPSNVRTSSRQRKSKRLFGCENYEFTAGAKKSALAADDDSQDADVDILDNDVNTSSSSFQLTNASITHEAETG